MSQPASLTIRPRWQTYLLLGRVSNLPTVWTNGLAGVLLAGGRPEPALLVPLLLAFSLFYTAGMFLNDAFDHDFDRLHRPERPIPAGEIGRREVLAVGFGLMATAEGLLVLAGLLSTGAPDPWVLAGGLLLGLLIVYYNANHKSNPLSPLVLALCRALVYLMAAQSAVSAVGSQVVVGALLVMAYLIGLTYLAKQEHHNRIRNLWPLSFLLAPLLFGVGRLRTMDASSLVYLFFVGWIIFCLSFLLEGRRDIPRAVISLIAGVSLLDAMLIAGLPGQLEWAALAGVGFLLALAFQRWVPGT